MVYRTEDDETRLFRRERKLVSVGFLALLTSTKHNKALKIFYFTHSRYSTIKILYFIFCIQLVEYIPIRVEQKI